MARRVRHRAAHGGGGRFAGARDDLEYLALAARQSFYRRHDSARSMLLHL
jgi:hypothetical protein